MKKQYTIASLDALQSCAEECAHTLRAGDVVALSGTLGAGKTTFVQAMARALGITASVTSPTFTILKLYHLPEGTHGATQLCHIDAYRLAQSDPQDIAEYVGDPETICCVEWPEHLPEILTQHAYHVTIDVDGDTRTITITKKEQ